MLFKNLNLIRKNRNASLNTFVTRKRIFGIFVDILIGVKTL